MNDKQLALLLSLDGRKMCTVDYAWLSAMHRSKREKFLGKWEVLRVW